MYPLERKEGHKRTESVDGFMLQHFQKQDKTGNENTFLKVLKYTVKKQ